MWTVAFWRAAGERATRTAAQALIAVLGVDATGVLDADWPGAGSVAGMAAVLSVLTSVATSGIGPSGPGLTETAETARDADIRRVLRVKGRQ